ncbi:hypothetical protein FisN_28Hh085 [Fistulifera solaris]|uniref:Uncharacterized protein n=1 Tax=Fistulifera solaris TaxID=1519565 RepID=A0A1Z5KH09_FISSO|nr:hypothetical protein FisN_28Hh085 [Fistulifera solaris]|eukprot:GAX25610.1 hypothetical protein FisN_28Hh085 [Fistulifera solaris]
MRISSLYILFVLPTLAHAAFPVCKICGSGVMTKPDGFPFEQTTATTCGDLQEMGDAGEILESMCVKFQSTLKESCGCQDDSFEPAEAFCSVCEIPGYVIVDEDESSMCGSLRQAALVPNLPASSCAELAHFTKTMGCNCQLIGATSDMPSDIPSFFPSDAPSDLPSDMPSDSPSLAPSSVPTVSFGPYPVCNLCGDAVMGNPNGTPIPGADLTTCALLQKQGSRGLVPESICTELAFNALEACGCGDSNFLPVETSCTPMNEVCLSDDECCGEDSACVGVCTIGKKVTSPTDYPRLPREDRGGLRARI